MKAENGLTMMDVKMRTRQDGKSTLMTEDKTLANGTKVMPDAKESSPNYKTPIVI